MPLVGVFLSATFENVASIVIPEDATFQFEVCQPDSKDTETRREQICVSKGEPCVFEWHGLKGVDRDVCDRRHREGMMKMASRKGVKSLKAARAAQLGEYSGGSMG